LACGDLCAAGWLGRVYEAGSAGKELNKVERDEGLLAITIHNLGKKNLQNQRGLPPKISSVT